MSQEVQGMLIRLEATTAQLRQEMSRADATVAQVSGRIDRQLATVDGAFDRAGLSALSAANMLRNASGLIGGAMSIRSLVDQADAYATIASRLRLVTSTAAEYNAAQQAVFSIAQSSFQPLTATAELYQRIATNQKELGLSGQQVAGIVGTISKTMAISGASAASANAALIQLGQAFASGVLRGEELNSVMEQAPALAQAIAAGMGKTVGELRTLGAAGLLTADAVVKALQSQEKAVESLYAKTSVTIGNSITAVSNSYTQLVGKLDQMGGVSAKVGQAILSISSAMDSLTTDNVATVTTFERISSAGETLAYIVGGRLVLGLGQAATSFGLATAASLKQAGALAYNTAASIKQANADAASAAQAVILAKSKQADAQAMLARVNAEIAADRQRQQAAINNLKMVQAELIAERQLEEQRLAAQISEQGRAAARNRMALARLDEVAIIKQIQAAEVQLAATTAATSQARAIAIEGVGATTLAVNAAVQASNAATATAASASGAWTLAATAGRGLLALLTGPVGLIAMAGAVAYSFISLSENSGELEKKLGNLADPTDQLIERFERLNSATQAVTLRELREQISETQSQIAQMSGAMADKFESDMRGMGSAGADGLIAGLAELPADTQAALDLVRKASKDQAAGMVVDWKAVADQLRTMPGVTEKMARALEEGQVEVTDLSSELAKQQKTLATLTGETDKNTTAQVANNTAQAKAGQTKAQLAEWDKYLEKLIETRDLLGANAEAEAKYRAAKMGLTAEQAKQAEIISKQTDTLKKIEDAVKQNDKTKLESLRKELASLYTLEQAQVDAAAAIKKSHDDAAAAAKKNADDTIANMQRVINAAKDLTSGVSAGLSGVDLLTNNRSALPGANPSTRPNRTGYDLLTNGATPLPAPVVPTPKTGAQRAEDAIAQIMASTTPNKPTKSDGEKLIEKQRKALEEFTNASTIALKATQDLAAAWLAGSDNVRAITIQQEIENEVLKTGEQARKKVTDAINAQHDAQDRLDVSKKVAELRTEVEWLQKEAVATLAGERAIDAFNVAKAVQAEVIGKKIAVGSEEYKQLVKQTEAQLQATKAVEAANKANDIVDRLNPQIKLLREYTEEQDALRQAMERNPDSIALYQDALRKLGQEYEANQRAATTWGQITIAAVDRIDDAFADMWKSVLDKSGDFMDTLKNSFRQFLAEMLHLAITKPIIVQIGSALGVGGLSGQSSGIFGGSGGGGFNLESAWNTASGAYSVATSGFGSSVSAGWTAGEGFLGGVQGALSSGAGYISSSISGLFASGSGQMVNGVYQLAPSAGAATVDLIGNTVTNSSGQVVGTASGATTGATTWGSAASGMGAIMGGIGGLIQGYQAAGIKGAVAGGLGGWGGATLGTMAGTAGAAALSGTAMGAAFGSILPGIGTVIGAILGAAFGSKLFGGAWETKDQGYQLGVTDGDFDAYSFEYQKKKGGLFSSNKKRTRLSALDEETQAALDATYIATLDTTAGLFTSLGVELTENVLDGLNVAATQISSKDRTAEEVQADIAKWFTGLGDAAAQEINKVLNVGFGDELNLEYLTGFVNNLYSVNASLKMLRADTVSFDIVGGRAVEHLVALAGGLEALNAGITKFYDSFTSETQKSIDTLSGVRAQFAQLNIVLPGTREAYAEMLRAIDMTTESGRAQFAAMTANAEQAAAAYSILEARENAFYSGFYSDAENTARTIKDLTAEIKGLGVELPGTRDGFRAAVEAAARDTSESGKKLYESLMSVAGLASQAFDALDTQAATAAQRLSSAVDASFATLQRSINAQKTSINDMITTARESASDLTSISNALGNAMKALRGDSDEAVKMLRAQAQATVVSALAIAKAGGSLSGFEGLEDALSVISDNDTSLYSSLEDFNREQGRNANLVAELNGLTGKQLTASGKTIKALEDQLVGLDKQLEFAQAQMDALNGVDNSVKTVAQAIAEMNAAVVAAIGTISGKITAQNAGTLVDSIYQDKLGRPADDGGKQYWVDQLTGGSLNAGNITGAITNAAAIEAAYKAAGIAMNDGASYWATQLTTGALTTAQLQEAVRNAALANGQLPKYATGGLISGPGTGTSDSILARLSNGEYVMSADAVRMFGTGLLDQMNAGRLPGFSTGGGVGETGPVLQITRPAQIYAQRSDQGRGQADTGAATVAELRELRREMQESFKYFGAQLRETASNTDQMANGGVQIVGTVETKAATA